MVLMDEFGQMLLVCEFFHSCTHHELTRVQNTGSVEACFNLDLSSIKSLHHVSIHGHTLVPITLNQTMNSGECWATMSLSGNIYQAGSRPQMDT